MSAFVLKLIKPICSFLSYHPQAIGCDEGGWRRVLGLSVVDTESYDSWLGFLRRIKGRGVHGVQLVTSDAHKGLVNAVEEVFQGASWQRCAVHPMRDCMREAGSRHAIPSFSMFSNAPPISLQFGNSSKANTAA